jgi:hypothetical protein
MFPRLSCNDISTLLCIWMHFDISSIYLCSVMLWCTQRTHSSTKSLYIHACTKIRFSVPIRFRQCKSFTIRYLCYSSTASFLPSTSHAVSKLWIGNSHNHHENTLVRWCTCYYPSSRRADLVDYIIYRLYRQGVGICIRMPWFVKNATAPATDLSSNDMACGTSKTISSTLPRSTLSFC